MNKHLFPYVSAGVCLSKGVLLGLLNLFERVFFVVFSTFCVACQGVSSKFSARLGKTNSFSVKCHPVTIKTTVVQVCVPIDMVAAACPEHLFFAVKGL